MCEDIIHNVEETLLRYANPQICLLDAWGMNITNSQAKSSSTYNKFKESFPNVAHGIEGGTALEKSSISRRLPLPKHKDNSTRI